VGLSSAGGQGSFGSPERRSRPRSAAW